MSLLNIGNKKKLQGPSSGVCEICSSTAVLFLQEIPRFSTDCAGDHSCSEATMISFRTDVTLLLALAASNVPVDELGLLYSSLELASCFEVALGK